MVQLQILSKVLSTNDFSLIRDNKLTKEYFLEYESEFEFIKSHIDSYGNVPDTVSFLSNFQDFQLLDVTESDSYLVNTIREEYLYTKFVPVIKKAAELLKADANEASRYLQSEIPNLTPHYNANFVDIIHDMGRYEMFVDKSQNRDAWFIPTGFPELDDILMGWQCGEEYVVIFARTGNGKSYMLVKSMQHAWLMGKNVGYISPEMSADKIGYRFDTSYKNFSNTSLVRGDTSITSPDEYLDYMKELSSSEHTFLVSTPKDFNNKITVSALRTFVIENKLDVLAVDGITYMTDERYKRGDSKTTSLTNISEDLMALSCELKIPVLIVVQSNRGGVDKDVPDLEDIRDSDGISHNATKVISLKRKDEGLTMCVKKNRDGRAGDKLTYLWDPDIGKFEWMACDDDDASDEVKEERREEIRREVPNNSKVVF